MKCVFNPECARLIFLLYLIFCILWVRFCVDNLRFPFTDYSHSLTQNIILKSVQLLTGPKFYTLLSTDCNAISSWKKEIIKWRKEQLMIVSVAVQIAVLFRPSIRYLSGL
jgi:hypothetical protein